MNITLKSLMKKLNDEKIKNGKLSTEDRQKEIDNSQKFHSH